MDVGLIEETRAGLEPQPLGRSTAGGEGGLRLILHHVLRADRSASAPPLPASWCALEKADRSRRAVQARQVANRGGLVCGGDYGVVALGHERILDHALRRERLLVVCPRRSRPPPRGTAVRDPPLE